MRNKGVKSSRAALPSAVQAAKRFEQKSEVNDEIKEVMQKVVTALKEE